MYQHHLTPDSGLFKLMLMPSTFNGLARRVPLASSVRLYLFSDAEHNIRGLLRKSPGGTLLFVLHGSAGISKKVCVTPKNTAVTFDLFSDNNSR
jgi:hypothetical protein